MVQTACRLKNENTITRKKTWHEPSIRREQ